MGIIETALGSGISFIGGLMGRDSNAEQQEANRAFQREAYQNSIQWKVKDAQAAGISPLYALGAPTFNPSVSVQSDPLSNSLMSMGQDISRSKFATSTEEERGLTGAGAVMQSLALERAGLQNDLLRSQIAKLRGQVGPPSPAAVSPSGVVGDAVQPANEFYVTENPKPEQRPPLMFGGRRWATNPNTSPMKAWEDQYGDEGPVASMLPIGILFNDLMQNFGSPEHWPAAIAKYWWENAQDVMRDAYPDSNPRKPKKLR